MSAQPSLFADGTAERERITSAIAERFACYGQGTPPNARNPIALTLQEQPPQFGFGVRVRDVVDAVCDELGALPIEGGAA